MPRSPNVIGELAQRLKGMAREEAQRTGTDAARWRVRQSDPLIIEEMEGELVLEDGDPDFTVGDLLRAHIADNEVEKDDQIIVIHSSGEWHAVDVVTSRTSWES